MRHSPRISYKEPSLPAGSGHVVVQRATPLTAAGASAALAAYPAGTILIECTDATDETTVSQTSYAHWSKV